MFAAIRQFAMLTATPATDMTYEGYQLSQCGRVECGGFIQVRESRDRGEERGEKRGESERAREREECVRVCAREITETGTEESVRFNELRARIRTLIRTHNLHGM